MKERLDVILVEQGYAPSREKAKAIIMSGNIEYLLHIRKPEEISEEKLALTEHEAESALQTIIEEKTGLSYTPEWDAVIKGIVDNSHTL